MAISVLAISPTMAFNDRMIAPRAEMFPASVGPPSSLLGVVAMILHRPREQILYQAANNMFPSRYPFKSFCINALRGTGYRYVGAEIGTRVPVYFHEVAN